MNTSQIDGVLRLRSPPVIIGYRCAEPTQHVYVKLLIALEPQLPLPPMISPSVSARVWDGTITVQFETIESDYVYALGEAWVNACESRYSSRRYVAFVMDTFGRTVLATRFLSRLPPPADILSLVAAEGGGSIKRAVVSSVWMNGQVKRMPCPHRTLPVA
jgi:hypothetical protein